MENKDRIPQMIIKLINTKKILQRLFRNVNLEINFRSGADAIKKFTPSLGIPYI